MNDLFDPPPSSLQARARRRNLMPSFVGTLDPRKRLSPQIKNAIKGVLLEVSIARRHRRGVVQARQLAANGNLKINVGCGAKTKPDWVNIDLFATADVIPLDLRRDLPFPTDSASIIYGEHVFEHLEYPSDARLFLKESLRVLRPGGTLSIGVPDAELVLRAYASNNVEHFKYTKQWHPEWCDTHLHQVNFTFRQSNEHKYAYDHETLAKVVSTAGFIDVVRRDYDPDLDSEERSFGTLYIEARKPG